MTDLPYTLRVDGKDIPINCDFRDVITIFIALNDNSLEEEEKGYILLNNLYSCNVEDIQNKEEAFAQAKWFLDWGKTYEEKTESKKILDWEKDYNFIISALNGKVKTVEDVRELPFLHWWTFLGYFVERGKCQYTTILELREKLASGKTLDKWEKTVLRENREDIMLKDETDNEIEKMLWG